MRRHITPHVTSSDVSYPLLPGVEYILKVVLQIRITIIETAVWEGAERAS